MKTFSLLAVLLCFSLFSGFTESLWDEEFSGYGTGKQRFQPGRILTVTINTDTKLSYSSAASGDRELVLTFSGGETGDLFSFLPEIQTREQGTREGEEELSISSSVAVRVQETNAAGMSFVQGSRNTTVNGGVQALTVSGWCDPKSVGPEGTIPFHLLADGKLTYRTLLETDKEILRENDISTAFAELMAGTVESEEETPDEAAAAAERDGVKLTEERKYELLLQYINRFLSLIFQE